MISAVKTLNTLQLRIKDKHASVLSQMAREVNRVFNFCNETSSRAIRERCQWLLGYDLQKLTAGFSQCEGVKVASGTVQLVCAEYATRRRQFKKQRLNGRVSNPKSAKYSLGWIPFKGRHAKYKARQIHAKIRNQRKDGLHKFSTALVKNNAAIFVGNVSSEKLVKTRMAKSTLDAGWAMFKTMLEYKSHQAGVVFEEVSESHTTQACARCASIEGPKGLSGLGIRRWTCRSCGAAHDRDVNAAKNMAARGLARLAEGTPPEGSRIRIPVLHTGVSRAIPG